MKTLSATLALLAIVCASNAQTIYKNSEYQWKGNQFIQGKFKATAKSATDIVSNYVETEWNSPAPNFMPDIDPGIDREHWTLKRDISHLPHYTSSLTIDNALFNMSLEESELAIEPDSTYRTGVYWGGVWTRDVSYSILHSLAQICPEVSMKSLRAKVNDNNRIIQDTGTGGAWPCSTDRVTWVLAAWECYLVTGSQEWLDFIYPVIKNTLEDDRIVAYDPETQLMRGETSWLDWREQEYPMWADPKDIYRSEAMGTTAVHFRATQILAEICRLQGQPALAKKYDGWANELKEGMNRNLWNEEMGLYAIYLYGRNHLMQHPQMEILGESFAVLWDIASPERQRRISQSMVSEPFGTPDFYPNLKDQYPYHNDAMWPFTQGYWMKAQAKAGNEQGVLHAISSIYRLAAFTLTNLENMVIYSGCEKGLPINSPRQLWGVAADIAIVPNIYFGITYALDGIHFSPFVPKTLKAERRLQNFKYRNAVLDIKISGFGNQIKSFCLDGVESEPLFPASLSGAHTIEITLANRQLEAMDMVLQENQYQPLTPSARIEGSLLKWDAVENTDSYIIIKDGKDWKTLASTTLNQPLDSDGEYAVVAKGTNGWRSYMSEPLSYYQEVKTYNVNRKISRRENIIITIPIEVTTPGLHAIDWRYANGNGPINTENKCATRVLTVDGQVAGVSVFPHRGTDEWNNWGWSNATIVNLNKGKHIVTLEFCDTVENMNIHVNEALLDQMRVTKL
ncbi:MAG: hypothetical protein U0L19_01195 [Bacteroidales bacterium]|nr:hypothetical protein [Bacteroidales bacterium]